MTEEMSKAASLYRIGRYRNLGIEPQYVWSDIDAAFEAGAAWQKERDTRLVDDATNTGLYEQVEAVNVANDAAIERHNEIRDALGTLGEGMAQLLQYSRDIQAAGLRGADRGVAVLKHLQEIGDNVRGVGSAIGDKFGVVLDAIKHVGETTEAVLDEVTTPEVIDMMGTTEPMHAEVKAQPTSRLGKLWADLPVNLEAVSDQTLRELAVSGQISEARYFEEFSRRYPKQVGVDPAHGADAMAYTFIRDGKALGAVKDLGSNNEGFQAWESSGGLTLIAFGGKLYMLRGMELITLARGA